MLKTIFISFPRLLHWVGQFGAGDQLEQEGWNPQKVQSEK